MMKKVYPRKGYLYATAVLALALGAGTIAATVTGPAAVASADSVTQDSAAVSTAGSAVDSAAGSLTSAASSAIGQGIEVTSGMEIVSPSYAAPSSATSSAVSNANSANVSSYSSAASSAASYMSSQATSLSSVTSSYSSAVSSYNTAADSVAQSSLVWSDAGVAVYGSYNSAYADDGTNTKGSTSYYDYTVVASQADLEALLGSEYISGSIGWNTNIVDVTDATYSSTTGLFTVTDPTQDVTFTMNNVATTNTGKAVNAVYTVSFGATPATDAESGFRLSGPFAADENYSYMKMSISYFDEDGNSVNGIFLGVISDIDNNIYVDALPQGYARFEGEGIYDLNNLSILNPDGSDIVMQNTNYGVYSGSAGASIQQSIPLASLGFTGWGNHITFVNNAAANLISENGEALLSLDDAQWTVDFDRSGDSVPLKYVIEPTAPAAGITYVSVDRPVLYELVTPPVDNPTPPKTPSAPKTPTTPQTPSAKTSMSPKVTPLATSLVVRPTVSMLPSTGDTAGNSSLMYGGFAVLGALIFAGVMSRKRRKLLEESKKAAEAAKGL